MSAQNPDFPSPTQAVGIDAILLDLQTVLSTNLDWLNNAMGRAYVLKQVNSGTTTKFLPMVYLGGKNQDYHPAHPDNDKKGSCFFIVKPTSYPSQQVGKFGFKEIDVSIIFTVNLKQINPALLETENFTQHLIRDVDEVIFRKLLGKKYSVTVNSMTDLFSDVWAEFDIDTLQGKAYGKMNYFRFDTTIFFDEDCQGATLNRCGAISQNITQNDLIDCIIPSLTPDELQELRDLICVDYVNQYQMQFDGFAQFKQAPVNAAYDFTSTDSFTLTCWATVTVAKHAHLMGKYQFVGFRGYFVLINADGSIRFDLQSTGGTRGLSVKTASGIISVGVKYRISVTYTGTETVAGMAININGINVPLSTVFNTLQPGDDITNSENLKLAALPSAGLYFNGAIDEWRVRPYALTAVQELAEWNGGTPIAPIVTPLVLYDRMGEGSIFGVNENWVSPDLSGTLGVGKGTETELVPYSGRIPS